jgi:ElaB/YqjD/DUF883 family membrane-anchored ribosome-binding protein
MQASTVKQAVKVGAKVAQVGIEAERLRDTVTHAVEDTVKSAQRAAKQGRYAVEDLVDEATYTVKRHPLQSVGLTLGIGFAVGTMFGLALSRLNFTTCCGDTKDAQ